MNSKIIIHFIINTISGKGNNNLNRSQIDSVFSPVKYHIVLKKSNQPSDIINHTIESLKARPSIIVACGGDGTINEVGTLLVDTPIKLGIIPFGSGNGLARSLKIPKQTFSALNVIKAAYTNKIDVGLINQHCFFCNVSLGTTAKLVYHYNKNTKRGLTAYILAMAKVLFKKESLRKINLKINEKKTELKPDIFFISNSGLIGYNFSLTPEASLDDGRLHLLYTDKMSFTEKLLFIFSVVTKMQLKTRKIHRTKFESLELLDTSKANFLIQIDGESILMKENKFIINIKKKALRVITPKL
jgi:YegS/Rv2252/BmrU family lipid kinase